MAKRKRKKKEVKYPTLKKGLHHYGIGSLQSLKSEGKITTCDFVTGMLIERDSDWDTGFSRHLQAADLAARGHMDVRSIYRSIQNLIAVGWMRQLTPKRCEYLQFQWGPSDKKERKQLQQNAYPYGGDYDPFNLLAEGKIDREGFLAFFHMNIGWQKTLGTTLPESIRGWAKKMNISARKLWESLKGLKETLINTISLPRKTSIFHLKFFPRPKTATLQEHQRVNDKRNEAEVVLRDGSILCFGNEKYKAEPQGFGRWIAAVEQWIFVGYSVPQEVIAFCQAQKEAIKGMPMEL